MVKPLDRCGQSISPVEINSDMLVREASSLAHSRVTDESPVNLIPIHSRLLASRREREMSEEASESAEALAADRHV
jgi:hypothetical protein